MLRSPMFHLLAPATCTQRMRNGSGLMGWLATSQRLVMLYSWVVGGLDLAVYAVQLLSPMHSLLLILLLLLL